MSPKIFLADFLQKIDILCKNVGGTRVIVKYLTIMPKMASKVFGGYKKSSFVFDRCNIILHDDGV